MLAIFFISAIDVTLRVADDRPSPAAMEQAVLVELNRARTDPGNFVRALQMARGRYVGNLIERPGAAAFLTQEGVVPVDEAIAFVGATAAEAPLQPATVLAAAAADHQVEQSDSGSIGHFGADGSGPSERVHRHGGGSYVGEVIAYGASDPAEIVRQLIVDDGVADRGHRRLLYDASLRYAGVSCGTHPVYRYMCVVTLARTADGQPLRRGTEPPSTDWHFDGTLRNVAATGRARETVLASSRSADSSAPPRRRTRVVYRDL